MLSGSLGKSGLLFGATPAAVTAGAVTCEAVRHAATKKKPAPKPKRASSSGGKKTATKATAKSSSPSKKKGSPSPSKKGGAAPAPRKASVAKDAKIEDIVTKMDALFLGRDDPTHPTTILTTGWRTGALDDFALDAKLSKEMQKKYPHVVKITNPKTGKVTNVPSVLDLVAPAEGETPQRAIGIHHAESGQSHAVPLGDSGRLRDWMQIAKVGGSAAPLLVPHHSDPVVQQFLNGADLHDSFVTLPSVEALMKELASCGLLKPKQMQAFEASFAHFTNVKNLRAQLPQVIGTRDNMRLLQNAPAELRVEVENAAAKLLAKNNYELLKHYYGLVPKQRQSPDVGAAIQEIKKRETQAQGESATITEEPTAEAIETAEPSAPTTTPVMVEGSTKTVRPNIQEIDPEANNLNYLDSMYMSPARVEAESIAAQGLLTRFAILRVVDKKGSAQDQQGNRRFDGHFVERVELYLYDRASSNAEFRSFDAPADKFQIPHNFFAGVDTLVGIDLRDQLAKIWYDAELQRYIKSSGRIWCLSYADYLLHCFRNSKDIEDVQGRKTDGTSLFENTSIRSMVESADSWFAGNPEGDTAKKEKKTDVETAVNVVRDPEPHSEKMRNWARLFLVSCCQYVFQLQVMRSVQMRSTRSSILRMDGCLCTTEMESNGLFIVTGAKYDPVDTAEGPDSTTKDGSKVEMAEEWSDDQRTMYEASAVLRANLPSNLLPWQREEWSWSNVNHLSHYYYGPELSEDVGNCRKDGITKFAPDRPKTSEEKKKEAEARANAEAAGEAYQQGGEETEFDPAQLYSQTWLSIHGGKPCSPIPEDGANALSRGFSFEENRVELLFHASNKELINQLAQSTTVNKDLSSYTTKTLGLDNGSQGVGNSTSTAISLGQLARAVRENISTSVGTAPLMHQQHMAGVQGVPDHQLVSATTKVLFVSVKVCPQTLHVYEISVFDPDLANADGTSPNFSKPTDIAAFKKAKAEGTLDLSAADRKKRPSFKAFINAPRTNDPANYQKQAGLSAGYWTAFGSSHFDDKYDHVEDALKNLEDWCRSNLGMAELLSAKDQSNRKSTEGDKKSNKQHTASCLHRTLIVTPPLELQRVVGSGVELAISNGFRCPSVVPVNSKALQQIVAPAKEAETDKPKFDFGADFDDLDNFDATYKPKKEATTAAESEWRKYYDTKKEFLQKASEEPSDAPVINRDTLLDDIASSVASDFARTALAAAKSPAGAGAVVATSQLETALKQSATAKDPIDLIKDYTPHQVREIIQLWHSVPQNAKTTISLDEMIARKGEEHFDLDAALLKVRTAVTYFSWCGVLTQERLMREVKTCFNEAEKGGDYSGVVPSKFPRGATGESVLKEITAERGDLVAPKILVIRKQNKLGESVVQFENAFTQSNDGLVHQYLHHAKTITGRLSSTGPNAQSIPKDKKIRRLLMSRYLSPVKAAAANTPPPAALVQLQEARVQHPLHKNFMSAILDDKLSSVTAKTGAASSSSDRPSSTFSHGVVLEFDYSQLEIITLAALTGDLNMHQDLKNKLDFHCKRATVVNPRFTYEEIFQKAKIEKDPEFVRMREVAKTFSFQSIYGAGNQAISKQTGLTLDQVKTLKIMEARMFPTVPRLYRAVVESVERGTETPGLTTNAQAVKLFTQFLDEEVQNLYRTTSMFQEMGTMYGVFPLPTGSSIAFHNQGVVTQVNTDTPVVKNYPIQSLAGEVVQIALGKVFRHVIAKERYQGKLVLTNTVHDSIWVDCEASIVEEVANDLKGVLASIPAYLQDIWLGSDNKEGGSVRAPRLPEFPVDVMVGPDMSRLRGLDAWRAAQKK